MPPGGTCWPRQGRKQGKRLHRNPRGASPDAFAAPCYGDFDSNIDKVAAYGIGGLVAGKLAAKVGLLVAAKKFLVGEKNKPNEAQAQT